MEDTNNTQKVTTHVAFEHQRRVWNKRVSSWEHHGVHGLEKVIASVLEQVKMEVDGTNPTNCKVLDIGCGTGTLAIPLAKLGFDVLAVDVSPLMIKRLNEISEKENISSIKAITSPAEELEIAPGSLDFIVSNYALHHLRDPDKEKIVFKMADWVKPNGNVIIGDMMLGRGTTSRDREIITSKALVMLKKGPKGWWRILKNLGRYLFRLHERPISIEAWKKLFIKAGFQDIQTFQVVSEAAIVKASKQPENNNFDPSK